MIGDGTSTHVWSDSWINPELNLKPIGPVFQIDQDLMVSDLLTRETKEWNVARINSLMPELTSHILTLKPSLLDSHDSFVWPLQKSGQYSVKSGYYAIHSSNSTTEVIIPTTEQIDWKRMVWNPPLLPKLKFFLWKVLQNALPSGDNLQRRGMLTNTNCCRCGGTETLDHIMLHCNYAREVWDLVPWSSPVDIQPDSSFASALKDSLISSMLPPTGVSGNFFPWLSWFIWIARNKLLFEKRVTSPQETLVLAIKAMREWEQAQTSLPKVATMLPPHPSITELPDSTIFINTDAS